ncbi:MAG: Hydrogenase isoenzymes formation protein HypC [Syntrophorhabdus sp. PtaU1.Bin058]|nr:MAG: Hydrogenase isoenzymes formation protein HypC [Syntrophorhabdus sp. PtaU1.Bin058]
MCLGIPGKIIELNEEEQWAVIECYGVQNKVYTQLVAEELAPGDYLMVHAGYAIGKIDREEAQDTLKMLEEITNT